ncbi:MAG: hypothetical protein ACYS4W_12055 [Planctomycetota bacterium]|jgi:hypothetical protein
MEPLGTISNSSGNSKMETSNQPAGSSDFFSQPIGSLAAGFLNNPAGLKSFFRLTGGSILYCLSALSILYGIAKPITPVLAKSNAFSDALPCIVTLNIYELALLGVLVTIVVWKNVTDDAISLVVLLALFLVASGMILGTGAYHAPKICLYIGLACTAVGLAKLYVMRRFISFQIGKLSLLGMTFILLWNFLTSSVMAGCFASAPATGAAYRNHWLVAWLVLLGGGGLIVAEAAMSKLSATGGKKSRRPLLHRASMVWVFALVVLAGAGAHQYGIAYMYRVDDAFGDYVPLIGIASLLMLELMRSCEKRFGYAEILVCCLPLGCTIYAVLNESITARAGLHVELLWYPPVILGVTGAAILWLSVRHRWYGLVYVVIAYGLACLLTVGFSPDKPHELNWHLCGAGMVAVLLALGVYHRDVFFCVGGVLALSGGLCTADAFVSFAKTHQLTTVGAAAGVAGVGTIVVVLVFGRKVPRAIAVLGAALLAVFTSDYAGISLMWKDVLVAAGTVSVCAALLLRTGDIVAALIVCIPIAPKAYILAKKMSSWGFVALSFVLLFSGAAVSLFCKQTTSPNEASEGDLSKESGAAQNGS